MGNGAVRQAVINFAKEGEYYWNSPATVLFKSISDACIRDSY